MIRSRLAQRRLLAFLLALTAIGFHAVTAAGDPALEPGTTTADSSPTAQESAPDCALEVSERVQSHYEQLDDFEADFEQVTRSVALGAGAAGNESARGKVVMAKPGKMRWEYKEPQESVVISDGVNLWIYDVAAREAQHLVASGGYLSGAALQFLMGRGVIANDFVVRSRNCSTSQPIVELELTPRAAASYERLVLRVDRSSGEVKGTTLVDLFGNVTTISFRSTRLNLSPTAETFQFVAPPGVEVIELTPPQ